MGAPRPTGPGFFCWVELATSDTQAASSFYGELFGWTTKEVPSPDIGTYTMFANACGDLGGMYTLMEEQKQMGIPPHWLPYILVDDVDASTSKARDLGAQIHLEPMDVMDLGRMTILADPSGAAVALWQDKQGSIPKEVPTDNAPCWFELATRDVPAAREFYCALLGWKSSEMEMGPGPKYTMLTHGGQNAAGIMQMTPEFGEAPPHWMTYFAVDDVDAAVGRIQGGGGSTKFPPLDTPPGRFTVAADGQGAHFSIIQLNPDPGCNA